MPEGRRPSGHRGGVRARVSDRRRPAPRRPRPAGRPGAPELSPHAVVPDEPAGRAALRGRQGTARRTQLRIRDRLAHPGRTPCHSAARLEEGKASGVARRGVAGAAATARLPAGDGRASGDPAMVDVHGHGEVARGSRPPTGPPPCRHPSAVRPGAKQPIGQVKNPCRPVIFIGKPGQCGYRGVDGRASSPLARPRAPLPPARPRASPDSVQVGCRIVPGSTSTRVDGSGTVVRDASPRTAAARGRPPKTGAPHQLPPARRGAPHAGSCCSPRRGGHTSSCTDERRSRWTL
jgi:hypothetical protein